jgi:hypothetical protein
MDMKLKLLSHTLLFCISVSACQTGNPSSNAPSIAGTKWIGKESDGEALTCEFQRGGTLDYTDPDASQRTYRNGTWRQDGASVYMETNHKYAEYRGQIAGTLMSGTAKNIKGKSWTWKLSLKR